MFITISLQTLVIIFLTNPCFLLFLSCGETVGPIKLIVISWVFFIELQVGVGRILAFIVRRGERRKQ